MDQNLGNNSITLIEKNILGCLFTKPKLVEQTYIKEEYFTNNFNRTIFKLTIDYYKKNKNLELTLFFQTNQLYLSNNFIIYITECMNLIATTTFFDDFQERLLEIYKNNLIINCVNKFIRKEINQEKLFEILEKIKSITPNANTDYITEEKIYNTISKKVDSINLSLSQLSEGMQLNKHDFAVIGARPGVGKTGFALNLLEDLSKSFKCIYFNMEMSEQQILSRLVSINSGVPIKKLTNPETNYQANIIKKACEELGNRKIKIFNQVQTIDSIRKTIIKESKDEHVIVFIDYIGLISGYENRNLYEKMTRIIKEIRQQSLAFDCTIIGLAQLNRASDNKSVPTYSDFKDTGEYEQSATNAIILHNPNQLENQKNPPKEEELVVMFTKTRNGPVGHVKVKYNKFNQKIYEQPKYIIRKE